MPEPPPPTHPKQPGGATQPFNTAGGACKKRCGGNGTGKTPELKQRHEESLRLAKLEHKSAMDDAEKNTKLQFKLANVEKEAS